MPISNKYNLRPWLLGAVLVLAVLAAYHSVWSAGFIWDDDMYVTANPLLTATDGLRRIWFSRDAPSQYFPLTYTFLRLEHAAWGWNTAGYHAFNVLIHACNVLLLWRLLLRLEIPAAWFGAAIFALHPVNVESVAWISELKNVLSLFFYLLALRAWVEFIEPAPNSRARYYILALLAAALALASKTTACTLPAALLLTLWLRRQPITARRCWQIAPFVGLSAALGAIAIWWERFHQNTLGAPFHIGWTERFLIACRGVWFYAGKFLWPANLTFIYPKWQIDRHNLSDWLWPAMCLLLALALFLRHKFIPRAVFVALLFYVAALSPLLGFIMEYTFRYTFVADHYQYIAAIAPCAWVAAFLNRALLPHGPLGCYAFRAARFLVLVTLGWLTSSQAAIYHNGETLWRANVARNPNAAISHNNLATALIDRGDLSSALEEANIAIALDPTDANAENNCGFCILRLGDPTNAIPHFKRAAALDPGNPNPPFNLGHASLAEHNYSAAAQFFEHASALKPHFADAQCNLGYALLQLGRVSEAIDAYRAALQSDPDNILAHNDLGSIFLRQGKYDDALIHFQRAVELFPNFVEARCNLGDVLLDLNRRDEAVSQYQKCLQLRPNYPPALARLQKLGLTHQ